MATAKELQDGALAHHRAGRLDEAERLYRAALVLSPRQPAVHNNLGIILSDQRRYEEAVAHLEAAVALDPDYAIAFNNLGTAQRGLRRNRQAEAAFRKAVALEPAYLTAHANLARLLRETRRVVELIAALEQAHAAVPEEPELLAQLIVAKWRVYDWTGLEELHARLRAMATAGRRVPAFMFLGVGRTEAELLACARTWSHLVSADRARRAGIAPLVHRPGPRPRLRIGYLCGDFREHATAYLLAEQFELHDRRGFEVVAYSHGPDDGGAMRQRIVAGVDRFVDLEGAADPAVARRIHDDGIDILVDLMGHTLGTRIGLLVPRPAPVQVHYLGFPGTTGAPFIDYLIVDGEVVPPGHDQHYSEALVRLPVPYVANDRRRAVAPAALSRAAYGLPEEGFVLCAFNGARKIGLRSFDAYMRILQGTPGSLLWLLDEGPLARANVQARAAARGVDPARVVFAPRLPVAEHLQRYTHADLFVDTVPGTAHTTASDALWMGCPVLTVSGQILATRVAASLVRGVGLGEMVAESEDAFVAAAAALARDPARLADLRRRVVRGRDAGATFDAPRRTRAIESAFRQMWGLFAAGEKPRALTIV